jgi:beta-lactamase class D
MKKRLALALTGSIFCSSTNAKPTPHYSELFKHYNACFMLYSVNEDKIVSEYNPLDYCNERLAPDSTFKIPLSLMAFDQGIISQDTVFKWNGEKGVLPEHERDQTPKTWLQYSVVWVSQQLTPKLGYAEILHYLADFQYGNQNFTGDPGKHNGLTHAWLSSSLKISAVEQLRFLKAMLGYELHLSKEAVIRTKENLSLGKLDNGAEYFGKTGSGQHGHRSLRDGWFVGFIQRGNQQYIFVSNLTDKEEGHLKPFGSQLLKPITLKLLQELT